MSADEHRTFTSWRRWDDARRALAGHLPAPTIDRLTRAMAFALVSHEGQTRPHGEPYAEHLFEVLEILVVGAHEVDDEVLVSAVLHDVVEDTPTSLEEVRAEFGNGVAELVRWLTKAESRADYLAGLRHAPAQAIAIKLADRLSNVQRLETHPRPAKRASYYRETIDHILPLAENHPWFSRQFAQWKEAFRHLEESSTTSAMPSDGGTAP